MGKIIFVSGIDTDIGKTIATGFYAKRLMQQGFSVITQKMIQTGCQHISADIKHCQLQGIELTAEDLNGITCPYLFRYPCSPHLAAEMENNPILPSKIAQASALLAQKYDYVLLEGAGGLAVPYNSQQTTLDYLVEQQLPLILVTSAKLGSINHTLLSLMVCQQHKIEVEAVIYNTYPLEDEKIAKSTQLYLQQYIKQHFPNTEFLVMDRQ
ncbi:dethiobiotin synthase [[Haemophilus] ducreyi]|uniref:dethiobiotin synthase n=1 Tax=Haemophilus ducreyi TaxID=730 RepID=UPI000654C321|nr:dethiobiotin synthase [[Haemophilus] ducreyi]AKO45777.1 ATP-dependent dethiobiotin synthetase BioD [[Haemophilus] ducreyi]AKO47164.1 ATP-dependent dethiobiotin synthetase BioD [[Haemophilus] ducreyi]AKO48526.1 ATP-dependent dethiobiotin synthetase BioD [[Haemophilus] ducreyi]AKO49896.1 ATP-dependent dethiobiotin synthetase BioD [[Haemophilus] ducreyi]ANF62395.1 dethiobiotin synthase [[Haemophilus] ducreyi]